MRELREQPNDGFGRDEPPTRATRHIPRPESSDAMRDAPRASEPAVMFADASARPSAGPRRIDCGS